MKPELTFHDYFRIIRKHRLAIFAAFAATFISTAVYTELYPPRAQFQATIRIQPPSSYSRVAAAGAEIRDRD